MLNEFLEKIAEILEVDTSEISLETDFRNDVEDWGSMKGFSIIIMMEEDYQVKLSVSEFLQCKTIGDLYSKVKDNG